MDESIIEATEVSTLPAEPEKQEYWGIAFGQRYIEFGQILQNPDSTIREVADAANRCGLALMLNIVPNNPA